ncbi:hypothetical protein [Caulobacter sp.]|jgi:hypothetical protein|uniref:hypothetical protein n=1 Tax=Caulobacter sp. TaxID=78 RepID=UPI001619A6F3
MDPEVKEKAEQKVFPAVAVEAALRKELLLLAENEAPVQGIELPKAPAAAMRTFIRFDSLTVVDVLCELDPILGHKLRDSVVQTGGYKSIDAAIEHLLPRIERSWNKANGVKA